MKFLYCVFLLSLAFSSNLCSAKVRKVYFKCLEIEDPAEVAKWVDLSKSNLFRPIETSDKEKMANLSSTLKGFVIVDTESSSGGFHRITQHPYCGFPSEPQKPSTYLFDENLKTGQYHFGEEDRFQVTLPENFKAAEKDQKFLAQYKYVHTQLTEPSYYSCYISRMIDSDEEVDY